MLHRMLAQLFEVIGLTNLFQHYTPRCSTCQRRVPHIRRRDEAVRILNTTTGVIVPQAMILAGFSKKDIANETVRRVICRRLEALEAKQRPLLVVTNNDADLSTLSGEDDDPTASATTTTTTTGPAQHPKPKRKQIRPSSKVASTI
jgi:hypothetical protein